MKKLILIFLFIGCITCYAQEQGIKIHFIDIGEGDAILIETKGQFALIDTGNLLSGYKLVEYLKKNNLTAIKHLIITHPHFDHLTGVFFIIPQFKTENFYDNGYKPDTANDPILTWYEKIFRQNETYKALKEGEKLKLGGIILEVLWPPDKSLAKGLNYNSLVIMLSYKNFRCLLTGDIDSAVETELLKKKIDLSADVLKVAHHGAGDATCEDFIKKVGPKFAIISVDDRNIRGYPARRNVLDRLKTRNIKTYRTDKNGSIVIAVNNKASYNICTEK